MAKRKKQWPEDFTAEEVSAVMSCLANHYPMCCEENFWRIRIVTKDVAKQDALADFAYENWGCDPDSGVLPLAGNLRAERYFERALAMVVELWRP